MEFLITTFERCRRQRLALAQVALFFSLACGVLATAVAATMASEYQLKAVFLFNFTQFVDWPTDAFSDAGSPLVIGILGSDPFGAYLDDTVRDERVNGRPLAIQRYARVDEIKTCHVLFVSASEAGHMGQILNALKGRSILTVGDIDSFTRDGGIIRFAMVSTKIRLKISLDTAQAAHLTISSKLLRPAEIVPRGE